MKYLSEVLGFKLIYQPHTSSYIVCLDIELDSDAVEKMVIEGKSEGLGYPIMSALLKNPFYKKLKDENDKLKAQLTEMENQVEEYKAFTKWIARIKEEK